ncbi:MAG: hypothetical protein QOH90_1561, partial [Actinomycetota bacterium]|nr:hypothetical protein [Actinomycetota bacterium]
MTRKKNICLALGMMVALVSCGGSDDTPSSAPDDIPAVDVTVGQDGIDMPESIEAEPTTLVAENQSGSPHQLYLARLNDGVTADKLSKALS